MIEFEDAYKLGQFHYDYLNTYFMKDAGENLARNNSEYVKELALQLKKNLQN